jgi:TonB family protein
MGTVILDAVIGTDGHVKDLKILKSVDGLDDAATDAVSQWQYSQTVLNGAPVEVLFTITVNFTLNLPGGSSGSNAPAFGERGAAGAPIFTIKQDDKTLKMTRSLPSGSATIIYRLDGKGSTNRLVPGPSAGDVVYISRWESGVLTSRIIVPGGPGQMSERKETIALEADTLVIRTTRFDSATRAERVVQTSVYVKGR